MTPRRRIATGAVAALACLALASCDEGAPSVAPLSEDSALLSEHSVQGTMDVMTTRQVPPPPPVPTSAVVEVPVRSGAGSSRVLRFEPEGALYTVAVNCRSSVRGESLSLVDLLHARQRRVPLLCHGQSNSITVTLPEQAPQRLMLRGARQITWTAVVYSGTPDNVQVRSGGRS